jgi:hydroxypyruvate isomerase
MPKFAANLSMLFCEAPFIERFGLARAAGFEGVEFLFPYAFEADQIRERLQRHALQLVLHNLPPGDWLAGERGLACDPRRFAEFQEGVHTGLEYARELGTPRLHCMAGIVPGGLALERARDAYIRALQYAADQAAPHGIDILIEPINHFDIPGYFLNHSRQALDILAEAARPNLFLQYDIYHMQRMEGELANTIRACLPHIRHMQLADTPGRHEPGTGEIHFPFLFRLLDELGYAGWIGCEYQPRTSTRDSLAWLAPYLGT